MASIALRRAGTSAPVTVPMDSPFALKSPALSGLAPYSTMVMPGVLAACVPGP